jgi:hypothetical protein
MSRTTPKARLNLEALEDRLVPTITNHGGALLPHVEVQAMYFGQDWMYSLNVQKNQLDNFLGNIVNSSYMDMLQNAGYGVGRGSASPSTIDGASFYPNQWINDSTIQNALVSEINAGALGLPDANRLYVVFVQDNVAVSTSFGTSMPGGFAGYHGAFGAYLNYGGGCPGTSTTRSSPTQVAASATAASRGWAPSIP